MHQDPNRPCDCSVVIAGETMQVVSPLKFSIIGLKIWMIGWNASLPHSNCPLRARPCLFGSLRVIWFAILSFSCMADLPLAVEFMHSKGCLKYVTLIPVSLYIS